MKSNFLKALDEKIAQSSGLSRGQARAERAAYLARAGFSEESKREMQAIRNDGSLLGDSRVVALLNFADGLYHYYKDVSPLAEDRFTRARAIAQIGGHIDIEGCALSWLGLMHYGAYRFDDMCRSIDLCIEEIGCTDSIAMSRNSLTVAISLHLGNRFDLAMPWYRRTHLLAVERRDEAMISSMLHNMAALWLSNCRNAQLGGPTTSDSSRQALTGALSSFNFDGLVGISALSVLTPLLDAQISSLEGDFERAASLYDKCSADFDVRALHNWDNWMLADREWCRLRSVSVIGSDDALLSIRQSVDAVGQADEQAAALARLAGCGKIVGNGEFADLCERIAQQRWKEFSEIQARIFELIQSSKGVKKLERIFPI